MRLKGANQITTYVRSYMLTLYAHVQEHSFEADWLCDSASYESLELPDYDDFY